MNTEKYIQRLFKKEFDVNLLKIQESNIKTPDFEFIESEKHIFVAELKDFIWEPASEKTGWKRNTKLNLWEKEKDNSVTRVAEKIHEAYKQLKTYNIPKIIIFFNKDHLDFLDLEEAYNGYLIYSNDVFGYKNTVSSKIANGRIKKEKSKIDLYFWIDHRDDDKIHLKITSNEGLEIAKKYFPKLIEKS